MCGLAGFFNVRSDESSDAQRQAVTRMTNRLRHRGPDDEGIWNDPARGIALGFRRLAIIDLSPAGHQPMTSPDGRFVVAFNGEVYNYLRIRQELEAEGTALNLRGHSDTEIMLAAFERWGVRGAVERFIGMFAIALWDRKTSELSLIRDRIGVKPMHYGWFGGSLLFASELKALAAHPAFDADVDRDALTLLVRHAYVPDPATIYQGVRKLTPGSILTVDADGGSRTETFWSVAEARARASAAPFRGSEAEATLKLEQLLSDSIGLRMIADVPLGVFLSGGIDSTLVTALMQQQSRKRVQTFTIGFDEAQYNEADDAARVAAHLGTDHTELRVTPRAALDVIPQLPTIFDEPFGDSSQIPTFLVSQLARKSVTVALSGDGGDEVFAGYNRYLWAKRVQRMLRVPRVVRTSAARAAAWISPEQWNRAHSRLSPMIPRRFHVRGAGEKMQKLVETMRLPSVRHLHLDLTSQWKSPTEVVLGGSEAPDRMLLGDDALIDQMMQIDLETYLPGDILVKVDRASMAVSLEAREPLLDHRLVEFAMRLPLSMKLRDGRGKYLLRKVLYNLVPPELLDRPKAGFGVPIGAWLRGPLRDWGESLISPERLASDGYLNPVMIRAAWDEHQSGRADRQHQLWTILMFQAWLDSDAYRRNDYRRDGSAAVACS